MSDPLKLARSIRKLSKSMLPKTSPTATYSDDDVLRMYSFRLLAHAEVEGFIEALAEEILQELAAKNDRGRLRPQVRQALMLHHAFASQYPPLTLSPASGAESQKPIRSQLRTVSSLIESNNGVSEKDVLKLFLPLGIPLDFFDRRWLASMTRLARLRGDVAHNSWVTASTQQQPTPASERSALVLPIVGVRKLCVKAEELIRQA